MAKIAFFCIPATGHTNPTVEVVRELVTAGNEVRYYSFEMFRNKIESTGATFIQCDQYISHLHITPEGMAKIGKDIAFSVRVMTELTLALDNMACEAMKEYKPDCIIADSMAAWGKFVALKLHIPLISSTTTFAFNRFSSKTMKPSFLQFLSLINSMPSVNRDIKRLRRNVYPVKDVRFLLQNDDNTNTIVYTSKLLQPCSETFGPNYAFVGPSIGKRDINHERHNKKSVYISLGTVNNMLIDFYKQCISALGDEDYNVTMSVGDAININELGHIPDNFDIRSKVNQIEVLQNTDVFISHCGMNSVNESLYYNVPLVMFPQTFEQTSVAHRVEQLGAGIYLKKSYEGHIRSAVDTILNSTSYKENAAKISESFREDGGAYAAVKAIMGFIDKSK